MKHLIFVFLAAVISPASAEDNLDRPNVLFIAIDDLRPELGCYGADHIKSPHIDALAGRGMRFNRAYCQFAVCGPSRVSVLTGFRPDTTRIFENQTAFRETLPGVVTLPQHFKNNGYFVQGLGKIYHASKGDGPSFSRPLANPEVPHSHYATAVAAAIAAKNKKNKGPAFEAADVSDDTYHDGALASMAIDALGTLLEKKQPFWLGVGFIRPHLPFVAPQRYWDMYDPSAIDLSPNPFHPKGAPSYSISHGNELRTYAGVPEGRMLPDAYARQLKHGYYASTSYVDAQVGRVLAELDRLDLRKNTIVILWGDHGWKLGEHAAWCKHSNCENDTRTPLIISYPGMKRAGTATDSFAELVDIFPTLTDLAGINTPDGLEGSSLTPILNDPSYRLKSAAFSQYHRNSKGKSLMGYSIRTNRYRLTRWMEVEAPEVEVGIELYDHKNDPMENVNIANEPANVKLIENLTKRLLAGWQGAKNSVQNKRENLTD